MTTCRCTGKNIQNTYKISKIHVQRWLFLLISSLLFLHKAMWIIITRAQTVNTIRFGGFSSHTHNILQKWKFFVAIDDISIHQYSLKCDWYVVGQPLKIIFNHTVSYFDSAMWSLALYDCCIARLAEKHTQNFENQFCGRWKCHKTFRLNWAVTLVFHVRFKNGKKFWC